MKIELNYEQRDFVTVENLKDQYLCLLRDVENRTFVKDKSDRKMLKHFLKVIEYNMIREDWVNFCKENNIHCPVIQFSSDFDVRESLIDIPMKCKTNSVSTQESYKSCTLTNFADYFGHVKDSDIVSYYERNLK